MIALRRHEFRRFAQSLLALGLMTLLMAATPSTALAGRLAWLVIDAKTGAIISETNSSAARHPASLTKMMTAYMIFDALDAGRITMATPLKVSNNAAAEPASKLYLSAGSTILVRDAIDALIIKSANDVATVVAENLGGSEAAFARQMTSAARQIGMRDTTFRNAHGLHDPGQVTTARDMYRLALALQDRFPHYYQNFAKTSFKWNGRTIGHHNPFLGHWRGIDGLKTGYTRASGYNLVSNYRRDGKHVIGVVVGADTSAARNNKMGELLTLGLARASNGPRQLARADVDVRVDTLTVASIRRDLAPASAQRPPARPNVVRLAMARPVQKPDILDDNDVLFARDHDVLQMMIDDLARDKRITVARIEMGSTARMAFMAQVEFERVRPVVDIPRAGGESVYPAIDIPRITLPDVSASVLRSSEAYGPLACLQAKDCFVAGVERDARGHYRVSDIELLDEVAGARP
jgi:D-alanyl-D-alanine carboxypeptidase